MIKVRRVGSRAALVRVVAVTACFGTTDCKTAGSLGLVLSQDNSNREVYVREVESGSAAHDAGVHEGDQVMMIDGVFTEDLEPEAIRRRLRGKNNPTVMLTVVRGNRVYHIRVTRPSYWPWSARHDNTIAE